MVGKLVEKRGWITWFMRRTNKTLRQGVCTTYIGHRYLPGLPEEWRHKVPPRSDLRSPGKISRPSKPPRSRWEFSQKRRDWEKMTQGKPVFLGTALFLYFPGPLLYFKSYIEINGKYKVTRGQQSWPLLKPRFLSAFLPIHKVLRWFTSSSGQEAC